MHFLERSSDDSNPLCVVVKCIGLRETELYTYSLRVPQTDVSLAGSSKCCIP